MKLAIAILALLFIGCTSNPSLRGELELTIPINAISCGESSRLLSGGGLEATRHNNLRATYLARCYGVTKRTREANFVTQREMDIERDERRNDDHLIATMGGRR